MIQENQPILMRGYLFKSLLTFGMCLVISCSMAKSPEVNSVELNKVESTEKENQDIANKSEISEMDRFEVEGDNSVQMAEAKKMGLAYSPFDIWGLYYHDVIDADWPEPNQISIEDISQNIARVRLSWTTISDGGKMRFLILRADSAEGKNRRCLNQKTPLHSGETETEKENNYVFYDLNVEASKTYYYRVFTYQIDGPKKFVIGKNKAVPAKAKNLSQQELKEVKTHGISYRLENDSIAKD